MHRAQGFVRSTPMRVLVLLLIAHSGVACRPRVAKSQASQVKAETDAVNATWRFLESVLNDFDPTVTARFAAKDIAVVEGDLLVIGKGPNLALASTTGTLWPHGIVPYVIYDRTNQEMVGEIMKAIRVYETRTNVRFVRYESTQHSYYINFVNKVVEEYQQGDFCYAEAGFQNKKNQIVYLGSTCKERVIIHELGHVLSMHHEQNRVDRDEHIEVLWQHISPDAEAQYEKYGADRGANYGRDVGAYDFDSIMHYDPTTGCKAPCPGFTMVRRDGKAFMKNDTLSAGDVAGINVMYPVAASADAFIVTDSARGVPAGLSLAEARSACGNHGYILPNPHKLEAVIDRFATGEHYSCIWTSDTANQALGKQVAYKVNTRSYVSPSKTKGVCLSLCVLDHH